MLPPGWGCWALAEHQGTPPGVGKHSLRYRDARTGSGGPGPAKRLGHPGAAGSLGRAENRVGGTQAWGLCLAQVGDGRGELRVVPAEKVLSLPTAGLVVVVDCGWECRGAFYWRLDCGSVGKGLLRGLTVDLDEKKRSMILRYGDLCLEPTMTTGHISFPSVLI